MPALLVKLVPQGSVYLTGGTQGPEGSVLCGLFFVVGIAVLLVRDRVPRSGNGTKL